MVEVRLHILGMSATVFAHKCQGFDRACLHFSFGDSDSTLGV
jgi:hypothetical protein